MLNSLAYLSLYCGIVSWSLLVLNFTPLLGNNLGSVFLFFPPAVLGLVLAIVAYFTRRNRKLAVIGLSINALPFGVLALLIYLLTRPGTFDF
jgi:hypothetical protein